MRMKNKTNMTTLMRIMKITNMTKMMKTTKTTKMKAETGEIRVSATLGRVSRIHGRLGTWVSCI